MTVPASPSIAAMRVLQSLVHFKVTLELIDNMKLPATYNQFTKSQVLPCYHCRAIIAACGNETVSRETERCQAVALRECGMRKWPRLGELTFQLFGVN